MTETLLTPFGSMSLQRCSRTRIQRSKERGVPESPQSSPGRLQVEIIPLAISATADRCAERHACLASARASACPIIVETRSAHNIGERWHLKLGKSDGRHAIFK